MQMQLNDTSRVITNSRYSLCGLSRGHAFCSAVDNTPTQHSVSLAALVVARYTLPCDTIWDICQDRPLLALPMAAMQMARNYVCLGGLGEAYDTMVDTLQSCTYLQTQCKLLYDGHWFADKGPYAKITVIHHILSISL
jgi:hypothetical protein